MNKKFVAVSAATLALAFAANAQGQTFQAEKGVFTLLGCKPVAEGVQCDFQYKLTEQQTYEADFKYHDILIYLPNGESKNADKVIIPGKEASRYQWDVKVIHNTPITVSYVFNIPNNTTVLRGLTFHKKTIENVPVGNARTTSAAPSRSAGLPASFQTTINNTRYNVKLSNCQQSGGSFNCSSTFTPVR